MADEDVVPDNAYTEEGRRKTAAAMSQMASIKNNGGMIKAAGTRYHPADQYDIWMKQEEALQGILQAALRWSSEESYQIVETHCIAKGDTFCRFTMKII